MSRKSNLPKRHRLALGALLAAGLTTLVRRLAWPLHAMLEASSYFGGTGVDGELADARATRLR